MKKKIFMLKKLLQDLKRPKEAYQLADDIESDNLGYYYFIFQEERLKEGKDQALIKKFDENGIPLNKTYIDVPDTKYIYFPISIGQMGLAVFHTFLNTGKEGDKKRFLKFADWFYNNANKSEKPGVRWLTNVSLPAYKNPGPWQSAFSQSRGISILLRAFQITGQQKFSKMAEEALLPFTKPVSEGGVTSFTQWGPFYEEYTASVPTLVLNGKIFSLCGLKDFLRVFPENTKAQKLFNDGVQTLVNILPEFDLGYWSRYNLCRAEWYPQTDPATILYQRLHIVQLELMFRLTNLAIFKEYSDRFRKQENKFNALHMYFEKYKSLKKIGRL